MIELGDLGARRKGAYLPLLMAILIGGGIGVLITAFNLPSWVGQVAVIPGFLLVLSALRYGYKLKPTLLSKKHSDQVNEWMQSGELATVLEGLSLRETSRLADMTRKYFGEVVLKTGVSPKGKQWRHKELRVGLKLLPTGYEGHLKFNVILYRRDLASLKRVPRPWRTISPRDGNPRLIEPGRVIKLPDWIAG